MIAQPPYRLTWWRRLSQIAMLSIIGQWSFYGIFRCPFIVPYVSCQSCPVITCHGRLLTVFWGFWLLLPLSVIFFGRSFCSWACPGGFISQILGKPALFKLRSQNKFAQLMPYFAAMGSIIAIGAWLIWGQPREAIPIRIGGFFESVKLTFEHANLTWIVRTSIVIGFLASSLLLANVWCRLICPTGGILEWLKSFSLFKIYKTDQCNDCNKCLKICEMGTRPAEANCTNCCDCLSTCPMEAIKIGRPQNRR